MRIEQFKKEKSQSSEHVKRLRITNEYLTRENKRLVGINAILQRNNM
jgi:hypothetical protein